MIQQPSISAAARAVLVAATGSDNNLVLPPDRLPAAAQQAVIKSMLKSGLIEEVHANDDQLAWRTADDGARYALRCTNAGLHAVSADAIQQEHIGSRDLQGALPVAEVKDRSAAEPETPRLDVRAAARAVLIAWDDAAERPELQAAIEALRTSLQHRSSPRPALLRPPRRPDTKRATVLALLRRAEGATVAQVVEATGWARHTVHGFFAGLKKGGTQVEVLERVRQVGPGKQGAAGSYTVYRVAVAG